MTEPEIIDGPMAANTGQVIYQVTLAQGLVLTNPAAFGAEQGPAPPPTPIIDEEGRVLAPVSPTGNANRSGDARA